MNRQQLSEIAEHEIGMIVRVLPEDIKEHADRCPVLFEGRPSAEEDLDEGVLGLFEGASLVEEPAPDAMPRIRIFLDHLWDYTEGDEQDFRDEVGTTYLHELGHFLGWDEDDVAERGLE